MSYNYKVSGTINAYPIKSKCFKDSRVALRYIDKLITESDVQIEEIFETDGIATTFVANNYSRFTLMKVVK